MRILIFVTIVIFTAPKTFAACEEFLGTMECTENDTTFNHTLSKIDDGYVLLTKSGNEDKELILNGEKYTNFDNGRKSIVSGRGKCSKNKLTLIANSEETSLIDPTNVMRSEIVINYEKIDDKQIRFTYEATSIFTESANASDFHRAGKGTCTKSN